MPIVTDGLVGYWHYKQGISGTAWANISPNTLGQYDASLVGVIVKPEGIYMDGVDDQIGTNTQTLSPLSEYTFESRFIRQKNAYAILAQVYDNAEGITFSIGIQDTSNSNFAFIQLGAKNGTTTYGENVVSSSKVQLNQVYNVAVSVKLTGAIGCIIKVYLDGVKIYERTNTSVNNLEPLYGMALAFGTQVLFESSKLQGIIKANRLYNRVLTDAEILQNYNVGEEIGLTAEPTPTPTPPKITFIEVDTYKVSRMIGCDLTTVRFKFDKDVVEWRANLQGSSYDTGTILDSGTNLTANTEGFSVIYGTELSSEGQNRINVYGKDSDGNWTPYNP